MKYELLDTPAKVEYANSYFKRGFRWKLGDTLPEDQTRLLRIWIQSQRKSEGVNPQAHQSVAT